MQKTKKSHLFLMLLLLSLFFFIWQLVLLFGVRHGTTIVNIITQHAIDLPLSLLPAQLWFWSIQLLLLIAFTTVIWLLTRLYSWCFHLSEQRTEYLGVGLWVFSVIGVLLANQYLNRASAFAELLATLLPQSFSKVLLAVWLAMISGSLLVAIGIAMKRLMSIKWMVSSIAVCVFGFLFFAVHIPLVKASRTVHSQQPNIIFIGLDAVRPDYLGYYGHQPDDTPALDQFFSQATNFTFSLTPLARTFVAWSSILTGQYPIHMGIRFNLIDQRYLHLQNTLSFELQHYGYYTVYGSDEWRFSNMSKSFGFNQLIGIHPGANDFVLGTINDFLLSDLIVNTKVGERLFPYSFANRAASNTYDPDAFLTLLRQKVSRIHYRPLFLAVHFCLPHYPYIWKGSPTNLPPEQLYALAIRRVDQQFKQYMAFLKQEGLLDNAIVVVLSDHGEAFDQPGDRLISANNYLAGAIHRKDLFAALYGQGEEHQELSESNGHGTDVLSLSQYHNVLAIRLYGKQHNVPSKITAMVSLIDLKKTILDLLGLPVRQNDGLSLKPFLFGHHLDLSSRMFFIETGFSPTAIQGKRINVQDVVFEGIHVFAIDPKTTHVVLKDRVLPKLISLKERAVYYKNWVLAYYPDHQKYISILLNRATGQWTDDLSIPFAKHSPAKKMKAAMQQFYGSSEPL
ncbi:MAG: sulfatase-like hydrolase/transferase [Gammaproteobacteria bacterium]|nr:sulfatase-like hydrolase/transferase [Gammaproteobacteria bacterium]MBU2546321.1 sulfatase-like hydrolase/transferase [Gammaproteobacteria bacterium]